MPAIELWRIRRILVAAFRSGTLARRDSLGDLNDTAAIHIPAATDADRRARCAAPGCGRPIAALVFAIELEIEGRRVTDAQLLAIEDIRAASGHAEICRRLDAAIKQQKDWQLLWGRP